MKTKFTQGQWHEHDGQIYPIETGRTIAILPYYDKEKEEHNANAKLMAAAPELFKLINKFIEHGKYANKPISTVIKDAENLIYNITH